MKNCVLFRIFSVGDSSLNYTLNVGDYIGTAGTFHLLICIGGHS